MLSDFETIIEGMKQCIRNAKQFMKDSDALEEIGSIGHATSLAILGYEEAHKAYLLIMLLPIMESLSSPGYKRDLRKQIQNHLYKQRAAGVFLMFVQFFMYDSLDEEKKDAFMIRIRDILDESKGMNLNKIKNNGFYVDPFTTDGVWNPMMTATENLRYARTLLENQINMIEGVVEFYSNENLQIPSEVMEEMNKLSRAIKSSRKNSPSQLKKALERGGSAGSRVKRFVEFLEESGLVQKGTKRKKRH